MIWGVVHLFFVAACFYAAGTAHEAWQYGNEINGLAGAGNGLVVVLLIRGAE